LGKYLDLFKISTENEFIIQHGRDPEDEDQEDEVENLVSVFNKLKVSKLFLSKNTSLYHTAMNEVDTIYQNVCQSTEKRRMLIDKWIGIFIAIARLSCGYHLYSEEDMNKGDPFLYLLTNGSRWFSFNSYMYALVNDIILHGVPSGFSGFDLEYDCPLYFIITMKYIHCQYLKVPQILLIIVNCMKPFCAAILLEKIKNGWFLCYGISFMRLNFILILI